MIKMAPQCQFLWQSYTVSNVQDIVFFFSAEHKLLDSYRTILSFNWCSRKQIFLTFYAQNHATFLWCFLLLFGLCFHNWAYFFGENEVFLVILLCCVLNCRRWRIQVSDFSQIFSKVYSFRGKVENGGFVCGVAKSQEHTCCWCM